MRKYSHTVAGFLFAGLFTLSLTPSLAQAERGSAMHWKPRVSVAPQLGARNHTVLPDSRRMDWIEASKTGDLQRKVEIAKELGDEGTLNIASSRGHVPLLETGDLPYHGPDLPTRGPDGSIHLYESKGGRSPLGESHGHVQGTPENAVEFYKKLLVSPTATEKQKAIARLILSKASTGQLECHVVRVTHVQGEPTSIEITSRKCTPLASDLATSFLHNQNSMLNVRSELSHAVGEPDRKLTAAANSAEEASRATATSVSKLGRVGSKAAKIAGPAGAAVEVGLRGHAIYETETAYERGEINAVVRGERHAENVGGCIGGAGGAAGGAAVGAAVGAWFGGVGAIPGSIIGGVVGAFAGGWIGDSAGSKAGVLLYQNIR